MKLTVFTENTLRVSDFKKVIDIIKESNCPNESLSNTFGDRYKGIKYPGKDSVVVYFDKPTAKSHTYEWKC